MIILLKLYIIFISFILIKYEDNNENFLPLFTDDTVENSVTNIPVAYFPAFTKCGNAFLVSW